MAAGSSTDVGWLAVSPYSSVRVIGGVARGRPLLGPKTAGTRPTSDLVRGAVFSMLETRGAAFSRVLDLYAGTGALGIEALSRGAACADFIERDRTACAVISANLQRTGLTELARVYCATLPAALDRISGPYGLIFIDPPYTDCDVAAVLTRLRWTCEVDEESTIAYEHSRRTMPPDACGSLPLQVTRRHGDTAVSLYYLKHIADDEDGGV